MLPKRESLREGHEAGKKDGGQHRDRNGVFVRGVFGVAAIELRSATIVRCACSRSIVPSSRQSGVRTAIVCNVEKSAALRRVEVCCTLSSAIAIVLGVRGSVCDECVRAEQSVRASSAINACAAAAASSAGSAIARMARTCVAVEGFLLQYNTVKILISERFNCNKPLKTDFTSSHVMQPTHRQAAHRGPPRSAVRTRSSHHCQ